MYEMNSKSRARFNFNIEIDPYVNFAVSIRKSERDWFKAYSKRHGVSMTQLFRNFLEELKEEENA